MIGLVNGVPGFQETGISYQYNRGRLYGTMEKFLEILIQARPRVFPDGSIETHPNPIHITAPIFVQRTSRPPHPDSVSCHMDIVEASIEFDPGLEKSTIYL